MSEIWTFVKTGTGLGRPSVSETHGSDHSIIRKIFYHDGFQQPFGGHLCQACSLPVIIRLPVPNPRIVEIH